jgi:excisionase family DNA binding protein
MNNVLESTIQASNANGITALAVDLNEAASLLGVSVTTIRREINRGNLLALRIGRVFRIRIAELHAYLKRAENRENLGR